MPHDPSPSLKDVAALAGVSFQTVSKALKGSGRVSEETRSRVREAAETLGYVPNALARGLQTRATGTLGVLNSDFSNTIIAQHLVGIEREARRLGFGVLVSSLDTQGSGADRAMRTLMERRVDGIICNAPVVEDDPALGATLRAGVPAVALHSVAGGGVPVLHSDLRLSGRLPLLHLLQLGHRRIGIVLGLRARRVTRRRLAAYEELLGEYGMTLPASMTEEGDWKVEGGHQAAHRLLDRNPGLTALVVQNDEMAVGVLNALYERGLRVPDDCSVVGCDDLPVAARTIPPLTTVRLPFHETGAAAVRMLARRLNAVETAKTAKTVETAEEEAGEREPGEADEWHPDGTGALGETSLLPVEMVYRASTRSAGAARTPP